jgi:hypothetical protein
VRARWVLLLLLLFAYLFAVALLLPLAGPLAEDLFDFRTQPFIQYVGVVALFGVPFTPIVLVLMPGAFWVGSQLPRDVGGQAIGDRPSVSGA